MVETEAEEGRTRSIAPKQSLSCHCWLFVFRDMLPWLGLVQLTTETRTVPRANSRTRSENDLECMVPNRRLGKGSAGRRCPWRSRLWYLLVARYEKAYHSTIAVRAALAFALLAPVSWFFLAKGHSYIHYMINYALWHLPFVPYGMLFFGEVFSFDGYRTNPR